MGKEIPSRPVCTSSGQKQFGCFAFHVPAALISLKNYSLIFMRLPVRWVKLNDGSVSCSPSPPARASGYCSLGGKKGGVLTFNLLFAISGALSTSLQSIIFIASLILPGAVAMKTLVQGKHNQGSFYPKQAGTCRVRDEGGVGSVEGVLVLGGWQSFQAGEGGQLNAVQPRGSACPGLAQSWSHPPCAPLV